MVSPDMPLLWPKPPVQGKISFSGCERLPKNKRKPAPHPPPNDELQRAGSKTPPIASIDVSLAIASKPWGRSFRRISKLQRDPPEDLAALEQRLAIQFPDEYRMFLLKHNGGTPEPATFQFKLRQGAYVLVHRELESQRW
jgi:hypothetical protein